MNNTISFILHSICIILSVVGLYMDKPQRNEQEKRTELTFISVIVLVVNVCALGFVFWCVVNNLI